MGGPPTPPIVRVEFRIDRCGELKARPTHLPLTGKTTVSDTKLRDFYDRYIEALNAHQFERMDEFIHESITLQSEPATRDDVIAQLHGIVDAVPDFHWDTQELAIDG